MKHIWALVVLILVLGCSQNVVLEDLPHLNGYWEIETVIFPDGNTKKYNMSTSLDFIELEGLQGYRKKVHPKFNGTYDTSDDAEAFTIMEEDGTFNMAYKNGLSQWKEQLVVLSATNFTVQNEDSITYCYKRYKPLDLEL